jgi:hypothetical protein
MGIFGDRQPYAPAMKRDISPRFLAEVSEVGKFLASGALGGFVSWVIAAAVASASTQSGRVVSIHTWSAPSYLFLALMVVGVGVWVLGAIIKPDPPAGPPGPTGPTGPAGRPGGENIFSHGYPTSAPKG